MKYTRTRIAPTPSGFLHLGNVMSFALTAFLAKESGASLLLRIDDLDRERTQHEYVRDIFDTLDFLQMHWEEGPRDQQEFETRFSQIHRLALYRELLDQLQKEQLVFACTCSRSQLASEANSGIYPGTCRSKNIPLETPGVAWRLLTDDRPVTEYQLSGNKRVISLPGNMKDFIVQKKDGFPAYQLTSMADDLFWGCDLVVRGEDLRPSTLAQLYLANVMKLDKFDNTRFHHHALLGTPDGIRLSKSAGSTSIRYLRDQGNTPADIFRMISAMSGLNERAEDWFSLGKLLYSEEVSAGTSR